MAASSRLTDDWSGICCCHKDPTCVGMGGWILTSSPDTNSANLGQATILDTTIGYCGHTGLIVTGASKAKCNTSGHARIGDTVAGCNIGEVIGGNPDHIIGS